MDINKMLLIYMQIHSDKLKCSCCCKIIPNGQIVMLSKEKNGIQEVQINHLCQNCHTYTRLISERQALIESIRLQKQKQIDAILSSM